MWHSGGDTGLIERAPFLFSLLLYKLVCQPLKIEGIILSEEAFCFWNWQSCAVICPMWYWEARPMLFDTFFLFKCIRVNGITFSKHFGFQYFILFFLTNADVWVYLFTKAGSKKDCHILMADPSQYFYYYYLNFRSMQPLVCLQNMNIIVYLFCSIPWTQYF